MAPGLNLSEKMLAACREGGEEAAAALGRAFAWEFTLTPPENTEAVDLENPPPDWAGAGLFSVIGTAAGDALLMLPAAEGLVPAWCAEPDETAKRRVHVLAQELAKALLPAEFPPLRCTTRWVGNLESSLGRHDFPGHPRCVRIPVTREPNTSAIWLAWADAEAGSAAPKSATPESTPESAAEEPPEEVEIIAPAAPGASPSMPLERINYERIEEVLRHLPLYSRSLLKIKTPVRVTLASTRLPVRQVLELAPGSLIQFQKTCDEPLDLEVGRHCVAQGEAVKVGEKFGLRITSIALPGERFFRLRRERAES